MHLRQLRTRQLQMLGVTPVCPSHPNLNGEPLHSESANAQRRCPGPLLHEGCLDIQCWRPRCPGNTKGISISALGYAVALQLDLHIKGLELASRALLCNWIADVEQAAYVTWAYDLHRVAGYTCNIGS